MLTCPQCSSDNVDAKWIESNIGEYQAAECNDCDAAWNECARDYFLTTKGKANVD